MFLIYLLISGLCLSLFFIMSSFLPFWAIHTERTAKEIKEEGSKERRKGITKERNTERKAGRERQKERNKENEK